MSVIPWLFVAGVNAAVTAAAESQERSGGLEWSCTRCGRDLDGNPRYCPYCHYTVYSPRLKRD